MAGTHVLSGAAPHVTAAVLVPRLEIRNLKTLAAPLVCLGAVCGLSDFALERMDSRCYALFACLPVGA